MEQTIAVLIGLFMGGFGGFVLSLLGWLESGEPFNPRKNVAGIMASTITGFLSTVAFVQTSIFTDPNTPAFELAIAFVVIFGAAAGFGSMGRKAVGAANVTGKPAAAAAVATETTVNNNG